MEFIYKEIDSLQTPVGCFALSDGKAYINFSAVRNSYDLPYEIYDNACKTVIGKIHTNTNYHKGISIKLSHLSPKNHRQP